MKWGVGTAAVVLVFIALSDSNYAIIFGGVPGYPHHIQTVVPSAFEVTPGERMVAGGETVGEIISANVTPQGEARIVMGLDASAWPLPTDSQLTLRMSGTIKYTDRYIAITRGRSRSAFAPDATVPARQFHAPVEYAQVFNIWNARTRAAMRELMMNAGPTFRAAAQPFRQALPAAPSALGQATAIFDDLGYDETALSSLVSATSDLTSGIARSNPDLRSLLEGAANTFSSIASQSRSLNAALSAGQASFIRTGVVLEHTARTLPRISQLAAQLEPAVAQLDAIAAPLRGTLGELVGVEPTAVRTLSTVRRAAPALDTLLGKAHIELLPKLSTVGRQAAKVLDCLRPYSPDIVNTIQSFAGAIFSFKVPNPRIHAVNFRTVALAPFLGEMPINAEQLHQLFPNIGASFPLPPGMAWNQPQFQPECGVTPAALNPADDSENNTYDPNGSKDIPFPSTTPNYGSATTR